MPLEKAKIFVHLHSGRFQLPSLALGRSDDGSRIKMKKVFHKLIRVLSFDAIWREMTGGEIFQVERHYYIGTASDSGRQNMAVVLIRQRQT